MADDLRSPYGSQFKELIGGDLRGLWLKIGEIYIWQFREPVTDDSERLWMTILRNDRRPGQ